MTNHFDNHSYALLEAQHEVDETKYIMQENITRILQRAENLDDLDDNAGNLLEAAERFNREAENIRKQFCWEENKLKIALVIIVLVVLGLVAFGIYSGVSKGGSGNGGSDPISTQTPPQP
eukprot:m.98118 g.98118  ORF g.98118 m.98118 type:complete len:120 (-) comp9000_c0_seq3:3606-3965(-)